MRIVRLLLSHFCNNKFLLGRVDEGRFGGGGCDLPSGGGGGGTLGGGLLGDWHKCPGKFMTMSWNCPGIWFPKKVATLSKFNLKIICNWGFLIVLNLKMNFLFYEIRNLTSFG